MSINWNKALSKEAVKTLEVQKKILEIEEVNRGRNKEPFEYQGNIFVADKESIQATQQICLQKAENDPIPTPGGQWILEDGSTVSFTVGQFKAFSEAFFMRGSQNYGVKRYHIMTLENMLADPAVSAEDIRNYDVTQGWY